MIISPPFLPEPVADEADYLARAMPDAVDLAPRSGGAPLGSFPLTTALTWHNGLHLVAPLDAANHPLPVRAVADGKVIFSRQPRPRNDDIDDPQNHNPYGVGAAWTDNGIVILRHTTEIGASNADTPRPVGTTLVYYSVYMHLAAIDPAVIEGRPLWRKDVIGKAGHILGAADHIHFEICLDPDNLRQLLGPQRSLSWCEPDAPPTAHGRTDSVFGSLYVYLPAGTPTSATKPTRHLRADHGTTLSAAQWVEIRYHKGDATISSYRAKDMSADEAAATDARSRSLGRCGSEVGTARTDKDFEYDLYAEATRRHDSLTTGGAAAAHPTASPTSSPSGWYELLRFGRNIGTDPLPADAAHWREIPTATGTVWADLNARGTWKFSDADFPAFKGWQCFDDDTSHDNQRCDSPELKRMIRDPSNPESIRDRAALARRLGRPDVRDRLRYAICRFPNEWDRKTIAERYSWLKTDETFQVKEGKEWEEFEAHAKAISFADLPQEYVNAVWHVHPRMFIGHMRECGWLSKDEVVRLTRRTIVDIGGKNQDASIVRPEQSQFQVLARRDRRVDAIHGASNSVSAMSHRAPRSRSFARINLKLWPAPHITACSASPSAPLSGFLPRRPSIFM